jgi:hypothetical protein
MLISVNFVKSNFDTPSELIIQRYTISRDLLLKNKSSQLKTYFEQSQPRSTISGSKTIMEMTIKKSAGTLKMIPQIKPFAATTSMHFGSHDDLTSPKTSKSHQYRIGKVNQYATSPRTPNPKSMFVNEVSELDISQICWSKRDTGQKTRKITVKQKILGYSTSPAKHTSLISDMLPSDNHKKVSRFEDYMTKVSLSNKLLQKK